MEFTNVLETFGDKESSNRNSGASPRNPNGHDDNYFQNNDDKLCSLLQKIFPVFLKSNYFISILLFV